MAKRMIKAGSTDQTIDVFVLDSSSTTGQGLAGLVYNSAGLACYYRKGATGSATALTLATQTVGGAHSDGGFVEIQATNMKGVYRLDLSDTIVAAAGMVTIFLYGATNMAPVVIELEIVAFDPNDAAALGLSRIDAAITTRASQASLDTVDDLLDTEVAAIIAALVTIQADTDDIQTRIPAALVGGRIDASVGAMAAGVLTAAATANDHIEKILKYDFTGITGEAARSMLNALRKLRNKVAVAAGTLTVYKEDDSTAAFTQTVATDPAAEPIISVTP